MIGQIFIVLFIIIVQRLVTWVIGKSDVAVSMNLEQFNDDLCLAHFPDRSYPFRMYCPGMEVTYGRIMEGCVYDHEAYNKRQREHELTDFDEDPLFDDLLANVNDGDAVSMIYEYYYDGRLRRRACEIQMSKHDAIALSLYPCMVCFMNKDYQNPYMQLLEGYINRPLKHCNNVDEVFILKPLLPACKYQGHKIIFIDGHIHGNEVSIIPS